MISFLTGYVRPMKADKKGAFSASITRYEALDCIPVKNSQIKENRLKTGEVLITYPINIRPWIAAIGKAIGKSSVRQYEKKIHLDELGTAVWDLMDGKRPVRRIISKFAAKYRIHEKESEVSVTNFLKMLGKRGLIGFK